MAPFIALLGFGLLYLLRRKNDNYLLFWKVAYGLGTAGFLASLFVPELHPYDQILLFGFSMPFLLADLKWRRVQVALLPVFAIGLVLSVMAVVTVVSQGEIDSANWVAENVDEGNIVADVEVSSMINMFAMREPVQTVFDQFLECLPDGEKWSEVHNMMLSGDVESSRSVLESYEVDYVIVGSRDISHYGFDIGKFEDMGLEVAFSSGDATVYKVR
jgi:hypothetical protein